METTIISLNSHMQDILGSTNMLAQRKWRLGTTDSLKQNAFPSHGGWLSMVKFCPRET